MSNIGNLTECSIDSLKIRIPLFLLDSYDTTIIDTQRILHVATGELDEEFKKTKKRFEFDTFYLDANIFNVNSTECLILLVNSKQLGSKYFKGITPETIKTIYNLLIERNILQCSFNTFLKASATDTDFKKDFVLPLTDYKEMIDGMEKMTKSSTDRDRGKRRHRGKNNIGIEFSKRVGATISNPFTKVYYKQKELETNSWEFTDRYLTDIDFKDVIRIETTVKDKEHFRSIIKGLDQNDLKTVLNLSKDEKNLIMSNGFNRHLLPRKANLIYDKSGLTSRQLMDLQTLDILINKCNYTFDSAINELLITQNDKQAKYRLKKTMTKIYNDHIYNVNYTEKTQSILSIYDAIGWK
tara:strand:+ start:292 stop:1353 length:1062 start_codon:yes stop_codon:yes gene_type:complete